MPAPEEPARVGLSLDHEVGRSLVVHHEDTPLTRYVYRPWDAQVESPRPYFHPIRTLSGAQVSLYRPHDHVWHKGIAWSLPNVGTENFWGGPTYVRGQDYQHLDNNGAMVHRDFTELSCSDGLVRVAEELDWITQDGRTWLTETRDFAIRLLTPQAWVLTYSTSFTNVSGASLPLGSPTTEGRPGAGYGGLFWRGPRSFSGGTVHTPERSGKDELNGVRAPWLGFCGRHDGAGGASTLVFVDAPGNAAALGGEHTEWFVRSDVYAVVSPSPFYSTVKDLPENGTFTFSYAVAVADGAHDRQECADLAEHSSRLLTQDQG